MSTGAKLAGVLAVAVLAVGVTRAEDKPKRNAEIEAILKKLPGGQHKFLPDTGSYEFLWEDAGGKTRRGVWFVAGSPGTRGQAAGSTTLLFAQSHGSDPKAVSAELKRAYELKSVSLGDEGRPVTGVAFELSSISDVGDFANFSGTVFGKMDRAIESVSRQKVADAKSVKDASSSGTDVTPARPENNDRADARKRLTQLKLEEKKLSRDIEYCRTCAEYWQKKYDQSAVEHGKLPNVSAGNYAMIWESRMLSGQQKLAAVQDEIADLEAKVGG